MTKSMNANERESTFSCDFASNLVYRLGVEGALWACNENNWRGISQEINRRYAGCGPKDRRHAR